MKKKVVMGLIIGACILGGIGCLGGSDNSKPTKVGEKQEQKQEQTKTEFKIGETIKHDGRAITVLNKEITQGGEYERPKQGNEYVIVKVKIENKGDKPFTYNPYDFKLKNSKGQMLEPEFITANESTRLESGSLDKDGEIEATIAFQAPKGDNKLQLIYTGNMFNNESKITISLQ